MTCETRNDLKAQLAALFEGGPSTMMAVPFDIKERVLAQLTASQERVSELEKELACAHKLWREEATETYSHLATITQAKEDAEAERDDMLRKLERAEKERASWQVLAETAEVDQLRAENEKLRAALKPFVECSNFWTDSTLDEQVVAWASKDGTTGYPITLGHCRQARSVLENSL